jgi:hypothetical protein
MISWIPAFAGMTLLFVMPDSDPASRIIALGLLYSILHRNDSVSVFNHRRILGLTMTKNSKDQKKNLPVPSTGDILIYQADDGRMKLDARLENETIWLIQQMIADLFQTTVPNISMHIKNIYDEGELSLTATVKDFLTVRRENYRSAGKRVCRSRI